jgi:putative peptide zinc metalloprotease protein
MNNQSEIEAPEASSEAPEESDPTAPVRGSIKVKVALAIASFALFATLTTWQFALLVLAAVGFHEQGHVWAMRRCGIPTKGFYFLPLAGGVAIMTKSAQTRAQEVFITFMGPIWGTALALVTYLAYLVTDLPVLAAATGFMAGINLFNLAPVNPLDGGRLMVAVAGSVSVRLCHGVMIASTIACGALAIGTGFHPVFVLATLGCLSETLGFGKREHPSGMSRRGIRWTIEAYMVLAILLIILTGLGFTAPGAEEAWKSMLGANR